MRRLGGATGVLAAALLRAMSARRHTIGHAAVRIAVVTALVVPGVAGCTGETGGVGAPSGTPSAARSTALGGAPIRLADHPPNGPGVTVGEKPLWSDKTTDSFPRAAHLDIRGDTVLLAGGNTKGEPLGVAVLDARTGDERWALEWGDKLPGGDGATLEGATEEPLPRVAGDGTDWSVVVPYRRERPGKTWELGLAVLRPADGTVRTTIRLVSPEWRSEGGPDGKIRAWRVGGGTVAALTTPLIGGPGGRHSRTVVADLRSGDVLWEKKHAASFAPKAVLADVVVAGTQEKVFAYDRRTGDRRWTLDGHTSDDDAAGGDAMVLRDRRNPAPDDRTVAFVRGTDGRVLARAKGGERCGSDGVSVACVILDGTTPRLLTLRGGTREPVVSARKVQLPAFPPRIGLGRFFLYDSEARTSTVYDDAGNTLSRGLPGRLAAITDRYVALLDDRPGDDSGAGSYPGYAVHRMP